MHKHVSYNSLENKEESSKFAICFRLIMRCAWASVIVTYPQDLEWAAGFLPCEMMG
jgi:hypothetical protein